MSTTLLDTPSAPKMQCRSSNDAENTSAEDIQKDFISKMIMKCSNMFDIQYGTREKEGEVL